MRYLSIVLLLFVAIISRSQDRVLDSLQRELQKDLSTELEIDVLNKISQNYTKISLQRAEQFAHEALAKSLAANYQSGIAYSYNCLGICNSIKGEYAEGLDNFLKALRIREALRDYPGTAKTLNNMTRLFLYQKDYDKAIEYSNRSRAVLEKTNDSLAIGNAYSILGSIYKEKSDWVRADKAYHAALLIFKHNNYRNQQGGVLLKIAEVYIAVKNYDRALVSCADATSLLDLKSNLYDQIELYQTMGQIYAGLHDEEKALRYLHIAMKLADVNNDSNGIISSRLKLSETFKEFKKYDSALYYHEAYSIVNEKVFNAERANQLATLEKVYETDEKDHMLQLSEEKIKSQNAIILIVSIVLFGIGTSAILLYRYSREKRRINKELTQLNRKISESNEEIQAQSEELVEANDAISKINENLEREVFIRTEKIKLQNQKLIEYAYFNAHNVRGPLARILGLAMLMERDTSPDLRKDYNERLHDSATELDNVLREITLRLEKEGPSTDRAIRKTELTS